MRGADHGLGAELEGVDALVRQPGVEEVSRGLERPLDRRRRADAGLRVRRVAPARRPACERGRREPAAMRGDAPEDGALFQMFKLAFLHKHIDADVGGDVDAGAEVGGEAEAPAAAPAAV